MKICFQTQRSFAYLTHDIAYRLKQQYGDQVQFSAYAFLRSSYDFLRQQTDVQYNELLLDEDIHNTYRTEKLDLEYLAHLEKTYGIPNLWPYLAVDRVVMFHQLVREYPYNTPPYTHEEMMRILQVKAKAIIAFLEREKPDVLVYSIIGSTSAYLLHHICTKLGIKTLAVLPAYLQGKTVISSAYDRFSDVEKIKDEIMRSGEVQERTTRAQEFLNAFRSRPHAYYEGVDPKKIATRKGKHFRFLLPGNLYRFFSDFTKALIKHATKIDKNDYSYIHPGTYLYDRLKRKIRNLIDPVDLYDAFTPDEEDYAFFPLHYEPEISILLHAPFHANQLVLIRQIARSLPIHFKLYVKEHPQMVPFRPRSYYKELKKIPNVKLIRPDISSFDVVRNVKLILTITSTVGWEAIMMKKPVITFGEQFYNAISTVKKCNQIDQLPYIVKEQLASFRHNENELLAFIEGIIEDAAPLDLPGTWEQKLSRKEKQHRLEPLATLLAKKIGL